MSLEEVTQCGDVVIPPNKGTYIMAAITIALMTLVAAATYFDMVKGRVRGRVKGTWMSSRSSGNSSMTG